jgi:hypothetical protein
VRCARVELGLSLLLLLAACDRDARRPAPPDDALAMLCRAIAALDCQRGAPVAPREGVVRRDGRLYRLDDDALRRSADGATWEALGRPDDRFVLHWLGDHAWGVGVPARGQPRAFHVRDGDRWVSGAPYPTGLYAIHDWHRAALAWRILVETDRGEAQVLTLTSSMDEVIVTPLKELTPLLAPPGLPEATIGFTDDGAVVAVGFRRDAAGVDLVLPEGPVGFGDEPPGEPRAIARTGDGAVVLDATRFTRCTADGCVARRLPAEPRAIGLDAAGDRIALVVGDDVAVLAPSGDAGWSLVAARPLADGAEIDGAILLDERWIELR